MKQSFLTLALLLLSAASFADMFSGGFNSIQSPSKKTYQADNFSEPAPEGFNLFEKKITAPAPKFSTPSTPSRPATAPAHSGEYTLGSGDKIRLIVFGEEDLTGEFEVDSRGVLSLPLIGQIQVGGRGTSTAENMISAKLSDGYLVNPRVSMEVLNFRPFYIVGEVNEPGNYPYIAGMTVLNAIAIANGYTYRANKKAMEVRRTENGKVSEFKGNEATTIQPGDVIHVKERWF